jgi:hypothetical protein
MVSARTASVLARCNGFRVQAGNEIVGAVATPVFSGQSLVPTYLLVRVDDTIPGVFRAVSPELVAVADASSETVVLEIEASEVAALPVPDVLDGALPLKEPPSGVSSVSNHRAEAGSTSAPNQMYDRIVQECWGLLRQRVATPLSVIRGSALTLRDVPDLPAEDVKQLAGAIERATLDVENSMRAISQEVLTDPEQLSGPLEPWS